MPVSTKPYAARAACGEQKNKEGEGPTSLCDVAVSYPRQGGHRTKHGGVAQLGEHLPCKQGVKSSNLSVSTSQNLLYK